MDLTSAAFPDSPPGFAVRLILALRRFLTRLADRFAPAELVVFDQAIAGAWGHMVATACRLGLADVLGDKPKSAEELATATQLQVDPLRRLLRALSARGFFRLLPDGRFEHTRLSRVLRGGRLGREREFVLYFNSGSNLRAWSALDHALRTGESPFDREHGVNVWEWFDTHADERELFAHAMMGLTVMDAPALAKLYPFAEVRRVCDVGGGRGTLLSELLIRHSHLDGMLLEGAGVLDSARKLLAARGVLSRVELVAGSFFEQVPSGADAYLLKNILHDWDDVASDRILRTVRSAASSGARVLLVETLVDAHSQSPMETGADLQMMVACSRGRERSADELNALLKRTGFRPHRVFTYPTLGVVEGVVD
jgi:hypothetical protein